MLFCQFIPNAPIKAYSLEDSSVTTVITTNLSYFDGLAIDGAGNIYVSCWGNNSIYRYDNAFSQPGERVSSGHSGPADIFYNQLDNTLAVPNYFSDVVEFIPMTPAGIDETLGPTSPSVCLSQNYPNPFNPTTTITFDIAGEGGTPRHVQLGVYDIHGREVTQLIDGELGPGTHRIVWNGRNHGMEQVPSGTYLYTLRYGENRYTRKMHLLR